MLLLDKMILVGRFNEFVCEFVQIHNQDQQDRTSWEYYLHRVHNMSYKDFMDTMPKERNAQETTQEDIAAIINSSAETLNCFHPCQPPVN